MDVVFDDAVVVDVSVLAGAAAATVATTAGSVVVVVVESVAVVVSVGCPIGFTGPVLAAVVEVDDDEAVVAEDDDFAMVDENTASFWAATGGAPEVLASAFLAVSCMA